MEFLPGAVLFLINDRLDKPDLATTQIHDEIPLLVDLKLIRALEVEGDGLRVGSRRHDEVILQPSLVGAIEDEVDSGINLCVPDPGVMRDTRAPFASVPADEVVALAGQLFESSDFQARVGADKPHAEHGALVRPGFGSCGPLRPGRPERLISRSGFPSWLPQGQHRFAGSEEQGVAGTPGKELHPGVRLAKVGLEPQRKLGV